MNIYTEAKLRRIAINLYLDNYEKEKLLEMYNNCNPNSRDRIIDEVEEHSQVRNWEERRRLRQIIRDS